MMFAALLSKEWITIIYKGIDSQDTQIYFTRLSNKLEVGKFLFVFI